MYRNKARYNRTKSGIVSQYELRAAIALCDRAFKRKLKPEAVIFVTTNDLFYSAERHYQSLPIENIPNLKRDDYWIQQGDQRKLPKLITI